MDNGALSLQADEMEVEIAGAGRRVAAYLLNAVFGLIVYSPFLVIGVRIQAGIYKRFDDVFLRDVSGLLWAGFALLFVYAVVQIFYMSRDGQSLGKKIVGIRVLKTDGRNPGFLGTVVMREVLYAVLVALVAWGVGQVAWLLTGRADASGVVSNIVQLAAFLVCFAMLFMKKRDRRTLQDLLADTVVVALPKK